MASGKIDLEIKPVATSQDVAAFWRVGLIAQGADPHYSPPLLKEIREVITPGATPFARVNDGRAWVALRAGAPVGRIYAVKNGDHLETHADGAGQFGFLEAIDDDAVWDALLAVASDFARERGLAKLVGPFSASINHECGLLVEGHETPSTTHTNHAPPYYARQLVRLGFVGVKDICGYQGRLAESDLPQRVARARAKWRGSSDLTLRVSKGPHALGQINEVYNDAWANNWGAVPTRMDEARFLAELAEPILPKDWTVLADWKGEPIGVMCMAPDLNEAVRDLKGKLLPFGWAKLLWRLKVSGVSRARIPIIGVKRAWRGTRVGGMAAAALLADAVEKAQAAKCERLEVSWMLADNHSVINLVKSMPAEKTKVWRIFEKAV